MLNRTFPINFERLFDLFRRPLPPSPRPTPKQAKAEKMGRLGVKMHYKQALSMSKCMFLSRPIFSPFRHA